MKPQVFAMPIVVFATLVAPALSASAQAEPMSTVKRFIDARNIGDEPSAMALAADEITYVEGAACPLANPCTGTQAARTGVRAFISDHAQSNVIATPLISGTTVTLRVETSTDAVRAAGLDRLVYDYTVDVQDGKLVRLRGILDATDPQTAAFQAFQAGAQLDELVPASSDQTLAVAPPARDDWRLASSQTTTSHPVAPPVRDDWRLAPNLTAATSAASPPTRDDWRLGSTPTAPVYAGAPPTRDDWRLASTHTRTADIVSPPVHDDWRLAGLRTAPLLNVAAQSRDDWML
jgi:hypothetical protein